MAIEKKFITIRGNQLFVTQKIDNPQRPTIVFLHDSLGCVTLWRDFPEKLSQITQFNYFIYDRLGYGHSDEMPTHVRPKNYLEIEAEIVAEIVEQCHLKNVILFGHSDGGSISLIAASKYPHLFSACIIEAAHIFVDHITLQGIDDTLKAYQETNLAERLIKYHGEKVNKIFRAWTETWMDPTYRDWNIEHFLPNIIAPVLFIQGENDEFGTLDQVSRTVEQVNGFAQQAIIPRIGHTPHKEAPEEILETVTNFLEKVITF